MIEAFSKDNLKIIQLLLDKGADVHAKAKDGQTALKDASKQGHHELVNILQAKGAACTNEDFRDCKLKPDTFVFFEYDRNIKEYR